MKKYLIALIVLQACSNPTSDSGTSATSQLKKNIFDAGGVFASNQFDGARLNDFVRLSESNFQATVSPENIPVNASAWFAFQIWSNEKKTIELSVKYTHHKHRYIPKLSTDGRQWFSYEDQVELNSDSTIATFSLKLNDEPLWVAAQEVISSQKTYDWVDKHVAAKSFLTKKSVGKTALNRDVYVVSSEREETSQSVMLIARQHPPEVPGGSIAFKAFFEEVMSNGIIADDFREKFNIYVFPLLNPDGADLGNWRHNAKGVDLNRDWIDFTQPETQVARDFAKDKVAEGKIITFGVDFHTSYNGPYLLILDSTNEAASKTRIIPRWIESIDVDSLEMGDYRRRSQELPYCYNWFFNSFGSEAVTYEEGDEIDRETIRLRARLYANRWMESMLDSL